MPVEGTRVLVVDDEPAICRAMYLALKRADYVVFTAQSGDAALAMLASEHVDVLLLDLRIPDTRGDVLFELAAAKYPHLRRQTLFMTGDISPKAQKLILACNCPHLAKPFELTKLITEVGKLAPQRALSVRDQSA
jgi:DNA-binding NtrC family response regulator